MLKKVGRWVSGRVQGSKGVRKYDDWMERNPWAGTALDVAGYAGAAMATPWALGKLGAGIGKATGGLKGMFTAGAAPGAPGATSLATGANTLGGTGFNLMPSMAQVGATVPKAAASGGKLKGILTGAKNNWEMVRDIGGAVGGVMDDNEQNALRRMENETRAESIRVQREQFEEERRRFEQQRENRRRISMMLLPLLQQQLGGTLPPVAPFTPSATTG